MTVRQEKAFHLVKLQRPVIQNVFHRDRLFKRIAGNDVTQPLIWVGGPAGSGKTVLISSYIQNKGLDCIWYQMDNTDKESSNFFHYLRIAAMQQASVHDYELPIFDPLSRMSIEDFGPIFFERLFQQLPSSMILIFDNCEFLTDDSDIYRAILSGLSRIEPGAHMIMISRKNLPAVFSRLLANRRVNLLGWSDLKMSEDECRAMADRLHPVSDDFLRIIFEKTDGWAAGIVLYLEYARRIGITSTEINHFTPEFLYRYFAEEVVGHMSSSTRDFLFQVSYFPSMTPEMATQLTDNPKSHPLLQRLHRNNFFTVIHHSSPVSYQFHPLFREFLQDSSREVYTDDRIRQIKRAVGRILRENNRTDDAAELMIQSEDWLALSEVILVNSMQILGDGRSRTLKAWIQKLPDEILTDQPWLYYWLGMACFADNAAESRRPFRKAYDLFKKKKSSDLGLQLSWAGILDSIIYTYENAYDLDPWLDLLPEIIGSPDQLPSNEVGLRIALSIYTALMFRRIWDANIAKWESFILSVESRTEDIGLRIMAFFSVGFWRQLHGHPESLREFVAYVKNITDGVHLRPAAEVMSLQIEGFDHLSCGDPKDAISAWQKGLTIGEENGLTAFIPFLVIQIARAALWIHDEETVERIFVKALPRLRKGHNRGPYLDAAAILAISKGDYGKALEFSSETVNTVDKDGIQFNQCFVYLIHSFTLYLNGKRDGSFLYLKRSRELAEAGGLKAMLFESYLFEACMHFDRADRASGHNSLRQAMDIAVSSGFIRVVLLPRRFFAQAISLAFQAEIEADYARHLLKVNRIGPEEVHYIDHRWPWPLRIYTFGRFTIEVDDVPVRFPRKAQKKVLDMVKVLIVLDGKEIPEQRITDILWPDADGDMAHRSFKATLHRLRKLIGYQEAVILRENRMRLNERFCWVDVWAFERMLEQSDLEWSSGSVDLAIQSTQKAMALYQGPFLVHDVSEAWTFGLRERLRNHYARAVSKLADHYFDTRQWKKALESYERALDADDLIEENYRRLMLCYSRLGRQAEAISVYDRCKKTLEAANGIGLSSETESLQRSLLSQSANGTRLG